MQSSYTSCGGTLAMRQHARCQLRSPCARASKQLSVIVPASTSSIATPYELDTSELKHIHRVHHLLSPASLNPWTVSTVQDFVSQSRQTRGQRVVSSASKGGHGSGLSTSSSSSSGSGASSGGGLLVAEGNSAVASGAPSRGMTHHRTLVLDSHYRPINVVPWPRAVMMDVAAKVDVLDYYPAPACAISGRGEHPLPAVMRVHTMVNLNELVMRVSCTRRNVLIRDKFTCQYCGARRDLTLDHVVPACRGGKDTWTNLVTACSHCNQKKADKLLCNLPGWKLRTEPREPKPFELGLVVGLDLSGTQTPAVWEPYIEMYRKRQHQIQRELRNHLV